jgi:molybdenum cofactor biosynthesis enzyme MoaA
MIIPDRLTPDFFNTFRLGDAGFIDSITSSGKSAVISGWSACIEETPCRAPEYIVLTHGDAVIAKLADFDIERPDVSRAHPQAPAVCGFSAEIPVERFGGPFDPFQLEGFAMSRTGSMYQLHKEQKYCFFFNLEPTGRCNLRCPQCPNTMYSGFNNRDISASDVDLVTPLIHKATTICYDGFGEFFLSKHIWTALQRTPLKTHVLVHTNGMLVGRYFDRILQNAPPLRRLVFSLDSLKKERYDIIRKGGDLGRILTNMRELKKRRDKRGQRLPYIVPCMKIMNLTYDELPDFMDLASEMDGFLELLYLYDAPKLHDDVEMDPLLSYTQQQPRFHTAEIAQQLQDALQYGASKGVVTHFAGAINEPLSGATDEHGYIASRRPISECPFVDCQVALHMDGKFLHCPWMTAPIFDWRKTNNTDPNLNPRAMHVRKMIKSGKIPYECSGSCCHFVGRELSSDPAPARDSAARYRGGWQPGKR